jgi:hypothetical protein
VAHAVVEPLEPVQIKQEQADCAAAALDPGGGLGEILVEAEAVAEAGQGIEAGYRLELLVEP